MNELSTDALKIEINEIQVKTEKLMKKADDDGMTVPKIIMDGLKAQYASLNAELDSRR